MRPPAPHDEGHREVGTATGHGCRDGGGGSHAFPLVFCSKPGFLLKPLQYLWLLPIPLIAKLLSSGSWCHIPLAVPTPDGVPREGWSAGGEAEPGLLPPSTAVISSSCCCRSVVPAGEGERGNNRKITLVICLKFCSSRGGRDTELETQICFWARQGIRVCSLPCATAARSSSVGVSTPQGLRPRAGLPSQGGGVCPRSCFPGNRLPHWPQCQTQT